MIMNILNKRNTYAELAAAGSDSLMRSTRSIMWMTPLSIRTSGRTICAPEPLDPSTKVPVELVTKWRGSPAAEVALGDVLFSPKSINNGE